MGGGGQRHGGMECMRMRLNVNEWMHLSAVLCICYKMFRKKNHAKYLKFFSLLFSLVGKMNTMANNALLCSNGRPHFGDVVLLRYALHCQRWRRCSQPFPNSFQSQSCRFFSFFGEIQCCQQHVAFVNSSSSGPYIVTCCRAGYISHRYWLRNEIFALTTN